MHAHAEGAVAHPPIEAPLETLNLAALRVHLIGVGGSGMSGAAVLLAELGASVSGSDLTSFEGLGTLVARGVRVWVGHDGQRLDPNVRLVVVSAAIPESNPELSAARARGVPVVKYAQLLGLLTHQRRGVAVAGTHGKSTTTGMCVHLFREAGLSPSFIIGARSSQLGGSSGVGKGPHFIVESCEFDRSFLHVRPFQAAILNLEPDHMDCYGDLEDIVSAFAAFAGNIDPGGVLVCNGDDLLAMRAVEASRARVETFGFGHGVDWRACDLCCDGGRYAFSIERGGSKLAATRLAIPGRHNVANALAAAALAHHAGADPECIAQALRTFRGVDRRLTWRGEAGGVTVVDDYAHHPTEIRVTLQAARERYHPRRLWVVFQPHQDCRTWYFMDQFATSFGDADEVIMPDVYRARDKCGTSGRPGSLELASRICAGGRKARYVPALHATVDVLVEEVEEGDLVLTMGAGDVWKVADELVERLCGLHRAPGAPRTADLVPSGGARGIPVPAA